MVKNILTFWPFFLVITVSGMTAIPLAEPGLFASHDGPIHVARQVVWHQSLVEGQIPPRWGSQLLFGYGYPLFVFLYPLPLMLGELLHLSGIGIPSAVESVFALSLVAGSIGMYLFGRGLFGTAGGLVVSGTYTFFPYRAAEVYVRGSIGEVVALGVIPWLLWTLHKFEQKRARKWWLAGIVLTVMLILSHNILAMLVIPIMALISFLVARKNPQMTLSALSIIPLAIGVTAWFWLPALWQKQYTIFDTAIAQHFNYRDHFVTPIQLFLYSPWGYGGSKPGSVDGMSFLIPKEFLFLFVISLGILLWRVFKKRIFDWYLWLWVWVTVGAAFLTLPWSQSVWDALPQFALVQYPWRMLALVLIGVSIVSGAIVPHHKVIAPLVTVAIIALLFLRNIGYFKTGPEGPIDSTRLTDPEILMRQSTTYADEHLPRWVKQVPIELPPAKSTLESGEGALVNLSVHGTTTTLKADANQDAIVRVHTFAYPGWNALVDGRTISYVIGDPYGTIDIPVPPGIHTIVVKFKYTQDQILGIFIALGTLVLVVVRWKRFPVFTKL